MRREKKTERNKKKHLARNHQQQRFRNCAANQPRQCGECRACCYVFPLGEKKGRKWCKHSTDRGCGCYGTRPAVCSYYKCLWMASDLPTAYRPDLCGLVVTPHGEYEGHSRVVISEIWRNAHQSKLGKELIDILKQNGVLIFFPTVDGGFYGIGSEEKEDGQLDSLIRLSERLEETLDTSNFDFAN